MIAMAVKAAIIISDPSRLGFLALGVMLGLVIGVIPGLGGLVGLSLLLPFTFAMDPFAALALMLGLASVTVTSDTIPAVLFGKLHLGWLQAPPGTDFPDRLCLCLYAHRCTERAARMQKGFVAVGNGRNPSSGVPTHLHCRQHGQLTPNNWRSYLSQM